MFERKNRKRMKRDKAEIYINRNRSKKKKMFAAALTILLVTLAGCGENTENAGAYETLDEKQLDSDRTDINDRAEYYEKYVEDKLDDMTREEKLDFFVDVTVDYSGRDSHPEDDIIFLRNDNVYEGDLYDGDDTISLPPGIYRIISEQVDGNFGEIKLLTPGEEVRLKIDYDSQKASILDET